MGDRGNIVVVQPRFGSERGKPGRVYFYSHWGGHDLPKTLQTALARRLRWSDSSYLARIIFCEMVRGQESGETGFGISDHLTDNEYPLLVVDPEKQTVSAEVANDGRTRFGAAGSVLRSCSFEEFVKLSDKELEHFREPPRTRGDAEEFPSIEGD